MENRYLLVLSIASVLNGCASSGKTMGASAGIGGGMGAAAGALADGGPGGENRIRNVMIGTAAGAAVGAGVGYFINKKAASDKEDAEAQGRKEAEAAMANRMQSSDPSQTPRLLPPQTEARWVPDAVRNNTFVPGHFEYVIISPARWEGGR